MPTPSKTPYVRNFKKPAKSNPVINKEDVRRTDISPSNLKAVSESVFNKINTSKSIMDVSPDLELAEQIVTSAVISPNDIMYGKLTHNASGLPIPLDTHSDIITAIDQYISENYGVEDDLYDIVRDSLVRHGAVPYLIIPSDKMSNVNKLAANVKLSTEANIINKKEYGSLGLLGVNKDINKAKVSTESNKYKANVSNDVELEEFTITDNPNILGLKDAKVLNTNNNIMSGLYNNTLGTLSTEDNNPNGILNLGFVDINTEINTKKKALYMRIKPEACVPIHVKGDPSKHLAYLILLDENGTPISRLNDFSNVDEEELKNSMESVSVASTGSVTKSSIITKAKKALTGITEKDAVLPEMDTIYDSIVLDTIKNTIKNSVYGATADIENDTNISKIIFFRALKKLKTNVLFLPKEMVSYIAVNFRENGTGQSYLEKISMLASMRAMLMFTNISGTINNARNYTEVNVTIDPQDPDPEGSMEKIIHEIRATRATKDPYGTLLMSDIIEWMNNSNYKWNFDHPGLPATKIEINEISNQRTVPDTEAEEKISSLMYMTFGLDVNDINSSKDPDFAIGVIYRKISSSKRYLMIQKAYNKCLSLHYRKLILNDTELQNIILEKISKKLSKIKSAISGIVTEDVKKSITNDEYLKRFILLHYINNYQVELPQPQTTDDAGIKDIFNSFKDTVEETVDVLLTEEAFPEGMVGELGYKIEDLSKVVKAMLIRDFMNSNDYFTSIADVITPSADGKLKANVLEEFNTLRESFAKALIPSIKKTGKFKTKTDEKIVKAEDGIDDEPEDADVTNNKDTSDESEIDIDKNTPTESEDTEEISEKDINNI